QGTTSSTSTAGRACGHRRFSRTWNSVPATSASGRRLNKYAASSSNPSSNTHRRTDGMDWLTASLLDLLYELEGRGVTITVGGGFGLHLKRQHLASTGQQTLFDQLPEPRSTNDLDLFLRAEVIADLGRTREVAEAICRLGYTAVEDAKFLQWKRQVPIAHAFQ